MIIGAAIDEPTKEGIKHILGYTVFNDGCLRGQRPSYVTFDWTGIKCGYQASSAGPWIATRDEFGDNQPELAMIARTNGLTPTSARSTGMPLHINPLVQAFTWLTAIHPATSSLSPTQGYNEH